MIKICKLCESQPRYHGTLCKTCNKERYRAYKETSPGLIKYYQDYMKAYREKNREKLIQQTRDWREKNKNKAIEYYERWKEKYK